MSYWRIIFLHHVGREEENGKEFEVVEFKRELVMIYRSNLIYVLTLEGNRLHVEYSPRKIALIL